MPSTLSARLNRLEQAPIDGLKVFEVMMAKDFENAEAMEKHQECVMNEHGNQVFFVTVGIAGLDGFVKYGN